MEETLSPSQALKLLVDALQKREILITRDDIAWAFESPKTKDELVEFVRKFINDDNLLSLEEKLLHEEIDAKRPWVASSTAGLDSLVPRTENDIERETQHLNDETEILKERTRQLKKQVEMLHGLQETSAKRVNAKRKAFTTRKARYDQESMQLQDSIEELMHEMEPSLLKARIAASQQPRNSISTPTLSPVTEAFKSDDRILARLQNYTSDTWVPLEDANQKTIERVEQLTSKLAQLTTEHIRTKLNRLYVEESEIIPGGHDDDGPPVDMETLFQDLEYLHQEIPTVAEMAAGEAFRRPTMDNIKLHHSDNMRQTAVRCEYIAKVLAHLKERNEALSDYNQRENLHRAAIAKIYNTVVDVPDEMAQLGKPKRSTGNKLGTPVRTPAVPSTPPPKNRMEEVLPEIQLLRKLGIAPPTVMSDANIAKLYVDRHGKLLDQEDGYGRSTVDIVGKALEEARGMQYLLEDVVMIDSKWGGEKIKLLDGGVQSSLEGIERRVRTMGGEVGKLQKNAPTPGNDARLKKFVEHWEAEK